MQLRVRELRQEKEWTQTQLAFHADLAPSVISQIETGKRDPSATTLQKLANALEVGVPDLFPKGQASLFPHEQPWEQRRFDGAPALPEVRDWVRGLSPEAALIEMDDDEFYGDHAGSTIRDVFDVGNQIGKLADGRDDIEAALKASTPDMPEVLLPESDKGKPREERLHSNFRRRRGDVGRWARSRARVRALNLASSASRFISEAVEEIEAPEETPVER